MTVIKNNNCYNKIKIYFFYEFNETHSLCQFIYKIWPPQKWCEEIVMMM